jgi:hypothetical protein
MSSGNLSMPGRLPATAAAHEQTPRPSLGRHGSSKYCPNCGQRFPGGDLHARHIVRECRRFTRKQRATTATEAK